MPFTVSLTVTCANSGVLMIPKSACACCTLGMTFIRGIKHDFPFINIRKVPREVLKTEGEANVNE